MIKFSVKKPMTIFVVIMVILALSVISFLKMTPDLLPSIDLPYMVVMTTYVGATPEEVLSTVTEPLEQSLATLEGLKNISSQSSANYSLVIMEFEQDFSMDTATVNTLEAIDTIEGSWPDLVGSPYIMKINPNMLPVTVASIDMDDYTVEELSEFLDEEILSTLDGIDGVASISTSGAIESSVNVMISESKIDVLNAKLKMLGVDISDYVTVEMVSSILTAENFQMPVGYVQDGTAQYLVSVGDKLKDIDSVNDLTLMSIGGYIDVKLSDVADCFMSNDADSVYGSINGNNAVILSFSKQSNYATASVSNNIQDKFSELEEDYEGLHFTILMDQGDYIYLIIDAILESLMYGAIFSFIILLLFLRDIRPTVITILSIPISLTFAIVLMYFSNITINMISLSGLAVAVGMLVDNSIVVIENIFRFRRMGVPPKKAAIAGAKEVGGAIVSSTLTTVCVFVPIMFITGITKQLFTDMALTITYALICSLLIALTMVPAISSRMFLQDVKKEGKAGIGIRNGYRRLLNFNLNHKFLILLVSLSLFGYSVYAAIEKGFIFIPDMSTPQMTGTLTMDDPDATLDDTREVSDEALERISKVEGVETVGGMLSSSGMGLLTGSTDSTTVSLYVIVDQDSDASGKDIADEAAKVCSDLPCTIEILSSSSITSYTSALGGSGVGISLYSNDQDALKEASNIVSEKLSKVEGIKSVDDGLTDSEPELHFTVDKDKAIKYNLTVAQVYLQIQEKMDKTESGSNITLNGTEYEITVGVLNDTEVLRSEIEDMKIEYTNSSGGTSYVRLTDIATLTMTESLPTISRTNQKTYISVTGEVEEDYNVTNVTNDAKDALSDIELPDGVTYEFDGENEYIMDAMKDLLLMLLVGVILVYLIMVAQFQSLLSPFIIMFTIPLAFTGGLLALIIFDKEISIIAMIGFVILVGVIVNNGIVLVDYTNQLRQRGLTKKQALIEAGATRMRPVLMTSITTVLGLIVMAIGKTAGTDMMQPLALVACGGLIYATILTLFVVPVIYDIFTKEDYKVTTKDDLDITGLIAE